MARPALIGVVVLAAVLRAAPAAAHPVPFSYLDLRLESGRIDAAIVVHVLDVAHDLHLDPAALLDPTFADARADAIAALIGGRLTITADGRALPAAWARPEVLVDRQSIRLHATLPLDRGAGLVGIAGVLFPYDPAHKTFVNVHDAGAISQAILDAGRTTFEYFPGSPQGVFAVVRKFVPAGVHHILIGPDHILFLVALLLLGGTMRRLALIVTGFTIAHSVTLTLAALDIFTPPAHLIEPAIALSIVYVGADNLLMRKGRDLRAWIAFAFGFIHGFGFANVLRDMDLPARALGWSLFSFNVGVELGQLLIVAAAAAALALLRAHNEVASHRLAFAGSIAVMAIGAFWFVERTFSGGL